MKDFRDFIEIHGEWKKHRIQKCYQIMASNSSTRHSFQGYYVDIFFLDAILCNLYCILSRNLKFPRLWMSKFASTAVLFAIVRCEFTAIIKMYSSYESRWKWKELLNKIDLCTEKRGINHLNSINLSWLGANILVKNTTKSQQQNTSSKYEKKFVDAEIIHTNTFGQWIDYSKILFVICYFAELFERYVFSEIFFIWERKEKVFVFFF